jgi:hypothetical protein
MSRKRRRRGRRIAGQSIDSGIDYRMILLVFRATAAF